jgi:hypothetical protein
MPGSCCTQPCVLDTCPGYEAKALAMVKASEGSDAKDAAAIAITDGS